MRELIFAVALAVAGVSITTGAALLVSELGWVVGGVLFGLWSWLVLGDAE